MEGAASNSPSSLPREYYLGGQSNLENSIDELSNIIYTTHAETTLHNESQSVHGDEVLFHFNPMSENTNTDMDMSPLERFVMSVQRSENPNVCYSRTQASECLSQSHGGLSESKAVSEQTSITKSTIQSDTKASRRTTRTISTADTNYD
ncbi:hypothetical protein AOL_s00173g243 [Orbilia oligospora ATCC 24927]|uniref:Uncharacterized protein n=1 Tax=Arthrobotrys oligospora (strain ATCC 24927 / CBS 115.81 / DSM 1491) TaxID=756982 RepID=G1XP75_ARTOA|nr:hypothetical protein AOL_s00173g243 [Orbilia oligospora ATCC 24927]EGX45142.1 hypothetical protein AOL_s00173g243 [Orbilia oligospora ATCC 24927]